MAVVILLIGLGIGGSASGSGTTKKASAAATQTVEIPGPVPAPVTETITATPTKVIATHTIQVRVTYTPPPVDPTSDGQFLVNREIKPGTWHTDGGSCYYARLSSLDGGIESIIVNDNITGPTTIQIDPSDKAVEFSGGCTWTKIG